MKYRKVFPSALTIGLAFLFVSYSPLWAEEIDELEPLVIQSTRLKMDEKNYAGSVTIITAEEIKKSGYTQVLDIVRDKLGLDIILS
ncbi:MAG: hypothetical protein IID18_09810, partial [Nitrospinae bacterium]|nr:hypothetical protein [Nitrospinota bacterium]